MERSLADVVKLTGAKPRSVQLWADAGIVRAVEGTDRAGTGVHRRFDSDEVKLIALLAPLARFGVPIGWLRAFAKSFREAFQFGSKRRPRSPTAATAAALARAFERAAVGEGENYLVFTHTERAFERKAVGEGVNYLVFTHTERVLIFEVFTDEHKPVLIEPARIYEPELAGQAKKAIIGILNLTAILSELEG